MHTRKLSVTGAYVFEPTEYTDDRGSFVTPFQYSEFVRTVGHPPFRLAQSSYSVSRRDVIRGLHFTRTPPGVAKYVYSPRGKALDIVFDLRIGSPTFGRWDSIILGGDSCRTVYFPVGVGHMFVALTDDTVMTYLLSEEYVPDNELAISPLDPALALPIPDDIDPIVSARDRQAPTLAEARSAGLLPDYRTSLDIEADLAATNR
ncbi:dTDP-4-dehydrorhamnose 3,5-epimerase family protein [Nocardia terpenica]|uniref:dTDP-4-dehydrorhamnose 3,5-epimerase family protein n=1 Tax=Nocardia terpenica TaxID=455432 RepID=UPI001895A0B1|nr:dTDP-4-dehydrorhamnose 3,5-epimerase family protein [Nocardia terpenica]MBF6063296.1 dTDP-4-dehydrorhamnose 3,5-epimerase family protein [Nocardia terpenica]MBF6105852.1 dTDP-4-dehydrorhamnose 3,5-epimerase family protein [Nocardia terpenica]MBF6113564.1 dTDP-4-dehydrorhamnose 3,5-epimerase family protein [Nocardia terpenica]MBF6119593.1 dTDP-4-dehydrorhamnose 3,5-epimerase family protein [Nocardia terpenica]MBF6152004.1 dTDP-4-dehydrorhamnose 3,5-epimerase family protein [Nocardia terpenic